MSEKVTATIKADKGYDAPWLVFNGTPEEIRQQIITTFGFDTAWGTDIAISELVLEASKNFAATYRVSTELGGKAIKSSKTKASGSAPSGGSEATKGQLPAPAKEEKKEPADPQADPLLEQIAAATSLDDLTRIWKQNQKAFQQRPEVGKAVKERRAAIDA